MRENQIIFKINEPETGIDWNVRVLEKGDSYGRDECLTRPVIEFFNANVETSNPLGSLVSGYYLSTFNEIEEGQGLCLEGRDRDRCSISSATVDEVKKLVAKKLTLEDASETLSDSMDGMIR